MRVVDRSVLTWTLVVGSQDPGRSLINYDLIAGGTEVLTTFHSRQKKLYKGEEVFTANIFDWAIFLQSKCYD